jgi:hypothetical protein
MWPHLGQLTGQGEFTASFPPPALPRQPRDPRRRPPFVAALSFIIAYDASVVAPGLSLSVALRAKSTPRSGRDQPLHF